MIEPASERAMIQLVTGEVLTVVGSAFDAEKLLSDAARSSHSRLAWFDIAEAEAVSVGVNPIHVVTLRDSPGDPLAG